jgi:hypothetical protein
MKTLILSPEVIKHIKERKDFITPKIIFGLIRNEIAPYLKNNYPKKYILDLINKDLGTQIPYQTFLSWIRKERKRGLL